MPPSAIIGVWGAKFLREGGGGGGDTSARGDILGFIDKDFCYAIDYSEKYRDLKQRNYRPAPLEDFLQFKFHKKHEKVIWADGWR